MNKEDLVTSLSSGKDLMLLPTPELLDAVGDILESRGCTSLLVAISSVPDDPSNNYHLITMTGPEGETMDEWSSKIAASIDYHAHEKKMSELDALEKKIGILLDENKKTV